MRRRPVILIGITADVSLRLMAGFPEYLVHHGWEVHIACSPGRESDRLKTSESLVYHELPMAREPSVTGDVRSLAKWLRVVRTVRPDITLVSTPKAGLLGGLAAWFFRVRHRVYMLRGLRYETAGGAVRRLLTTLERVAGATASDVIAVSASLRDKAVHDKVIAERKIVVLGAGSSNGVDVQRFAGVDAAKTRLRSQHSQRPHTPVVGYIGRIHPDKGLDLLTDAAATLKQRGVGGRLLIVGPVDDEQFADHLSSTLARTGFPAELSAAVDDVVDVLPLIDVLCLPTRREGFPNVVLEAAAASIPTVATAATGITDAIVDGHTGYIVPRRDPDELANHLQALLEDDVHRHLMGQQAREYVERHYSRIDVWEKQHSFLRSLLSSTNSG